MSGIGEIVTEIAKLLVDDPDSVQLEERIDDALHTVELRVAKSDIGKIIGKHGAHAQALRTILMAASGKYKKRIILEILDQ